MSTSKLRLRAQTYEQLAAMIGAGVSIERALTVLSESGSFGRRRREFQRILKEVQRGNPFGEALGRATSLVPPLDRAVLSVGEQSGRLEETLKLLAQSCHRNAALLGEMISNLAYPLVVIHVALLVFPIAHIQAIVLEGDFTPFLMQKLRAFGMLYGAVLIAVYILPWLVGGSAKSLFASLLRPVPVLGRGLHQLALARVAFALDVQLAAGVPVLDAWPLAGELCGSASLHREIRSWQKELARGATPGEMAARSRGFSGLFAEFYRTGELSGRLEESLDQIQRYYSEEGSARMRAIAQWVPRILYFAVVLYVVKAVFGFYSGYFDRLNF
jgi:general secretion pathway protein F